MIYFQCCVWTCIFYPKFKNVIIIKIPNRFGTIGNCKEITNVFSPKTMPGNWFHEINFHFHLIFVWQEYHVLAHCWFQIVVLEKKCQKEMLYWFIVKAIRQEISFMLLHTCMIIGRNCPMNFFFKNPWKSVKIIEHENISYFFCSFLWPTTLYNM